MVYKFRKLIVVIMCLALLFCSYGPVVYAIDNEEQSEIETFVFDADGNLQETYGNATQIDIDPSNNQINEKQLFDEIDQSSILEDSSKIDEIDQAVDVEQNDEYEQDNNLRQCDCELIENVVKHEQDCEGYIDSDECNCDLENGCHLESCVYFIDDDIPPVVEESPDITDDDVPTTDIEDETTCECENDIHIESCYLYRNVCEECGLPDGEHLSSCSLYEMICDQCFLLDGDHTDDCINRPKTLFEILITTIDLAEFVDILKDTNNQAVLNDLSSNEIEELILHIDEILNGDEDLEIEALTILYSLPNAERPNVEILDSEYIYFDLSAGNVSITASSYSGYIYVDGVATAVSGSHLSSNKYWVYQSAANIDVDQYGVPIYRRVSYNNESWAQYIINNTNIKDVVSNWTESAASVGRTSTGNYISVSGNSTYDVVIDNIWSSYITSSTSRSTGGIGFVPSSSGEMILRLRGDNRVGNIHYNSTNNGAKLIFTNGDSEDSPGSITCASFDGKSNHYNSVIGGNDSSYDSSYGITINGGIVYAGSQTGDNCSAIGGGGNGYGKVYINGGVVTAVANSSGAAIGGGIGESSQGGNAYIEITGGTTYAYNFGYVSSMSGTKYFIPAAAIGGGSSCKSSGNESTTINISGGYVYAQSLGGAAIGGGSSTMSSGGAATINISGSAVVEAQSVSGTATNGASVAHGVSIGGGTAGAAGKSNGGSITLNVSGGSLYTGSIGGGGCANNSGSIGSGTVTINGGSIRGQIVMGAGSVSKNIFNMTGGSIDNNPENNKNGFAFLEPNGGAVYLEYGDAIIEGGTIKNCTSDNGGAVYVVGGNFKMLGGKITNCSSVYGGAVHVNGGSFEIIDGEMSQNSSTNGGAVYVNGGNLTVNGGLFKNNSATDGGAAYIKGGNVNMYNGTFDSNSAINNGGAIYVNTSSVDVTINILDGQIINNISENHGGAIGANAVGDYSIVLNIGDHDCLGVETHNHEDNTCPEISNNTTSDLGGAFCLHGSKSGLALNIYCGDVAGNIAIRNEGSNSINQGGGSVTVYGGHIDPGIMVGGGSYEDLRLDAEQIILRFWSNYNGGPTEPHLVEVTAGVTVTFPLDTYVRLGHQLSGWSTAPDATGLYVPSNGNHTIVESEDGYLDFYAAWDIESSYIVYIPDTMEIEGNGVGAIDIEADINYFTAVSSLNVYIDSDFSLEYEAANSYHLDYRITSSEFGSNHVLDSGDIAATFQYNNKAKKILTAKIIQSQLDACMFSGIYSDVLTFVVEYDENE